MRQVSTFESRGGITFGRPVSSISTREALLHTMIGRLRRLGQLLSRPQTKGLILAISLLAFEIFNFSTSRYALDSFLGNASFAGLTWATILAVAFCAIDFGGLIYLYGPERIQGGRNEAWYLLGAWLLGATISALMTWWTVSLILSNRESGFIFMNRSEMLHYVPMFVALAVWMIRLLFIRILSSAGNLLIRPVGARGVLKTQPPIVRSRLRPQPAVTMTGSKLHDVPLTTNELPAFLLKTWAGVDPESDRIRPGTRGSIIA